MAKLTRHNGLAIRCLRIKDGVPPVEFASRVGITYKCLNNLENDRKDASAILLHRIAAALTVPVGAIIRDPSCLAGAAGSKTPASDDNTVDVA